MRGRRYPFDSMERLFDQMRDEMMGSWSSAPALEDEGGWDAGISIEETDDGFVVLADLPGFERDELALSLHDDQLRLSGEHEVGDGLGYRSRTVTESITLPAHVEPEDASATYRNGVLEVRFVVDEDDEIAGSNIDIE